jgi:hypothetical protein
MAALCGTVRLDARALRQVGDAATISGYLGKTGNRKAAGEFVKWRTRTRQRATMPHW